MSEQRPSVPGENLACLGERCRPTVAVNELRTESAFQTSDVSANTRLRPVYMRRRCGEPALVDDREKGLQPVKFHLMIVRLSVAKCLRDPPRA